MENFWSLRSDSMAVTTTIPPQAYTRDTLVKAIEWIGTQPQSIREKATSADLVVSYYMQACRKAAAHMEAPVSQENFKADLRNLAEGLRQFEDQVAPPPQPTRFPSYGPTPDWPPQPALHVQPAPMPAAPPISPPPQPQPPKAHTAGLTWNIDPRSLAAAKDIQNRLNLGSEAEAIRLLITLGAERARELFP